MHLSLLLSFCFFGAFSDFIFLKHDYKELAIIANKSNTDQHIFYLGWSLGEENNEVVVIEIERDNWLPRIELKVSTLYFRLTTTRYACLHSV